MPDEGHRLLVTTFSRFFPSVLETKKALLVPATKEQINAAQLHLVEEDERENHFFLSKNKLTKFNLENSADLLKQLILRKKLCANKIN